MGLAIRRASPTENHQEILGLFERNFGDRCEKRYDYLFLNPAGQCWTWFVYDQTSKAVLGTTSLFSKTMYVNGDRLTAGHVMFFAVDARHRSLGPAVMLQRATFEPVNNGELAFCYDCPPHDRGMSTFVRLGMRPNCEMIRYALPLRSDAGAAEVLVARRHGELLAFAVLTSHGGGFISVAELFGVHLAEVAPALLEAIIEIGRREKLLSVYAYLAEGGELSRLFRSAGFHPVKRAARIVAYEKPNGRAFERLTSGQHWAFSQVELMQ